MENKLELTEELLINRLNLIDQAIDSHIARLLTHDGILCYFVKDNEVSTKTEYESKEQINESIVSLENHRNYYKKKLKKLQNPKTGEKE